MLSGGIFRRRKIPTSEDNPRIPIRKRQIPAFGEKTLAYHIAFSKPVTVGENRSDRLTTLNRELQSVLMALGKPHDVRLDEHYPMHSVDIPWRSMRVTLVFELHEEMVTQAIYVHVEFDEHEPGIDPYALEIDEHFKRLCGLIAGDAVIDNQQSSKILYEDVWKRLFSDLPQIPNPDYQFRDELEKPLILAHFHGIVIESMVPNSIGITDIDVNKELYGAFKPFLCCYKNVSVHDYSICMLRGGRAFHASTLGSSDEDSNKGPHRYLICAHSLNRAELGDLLDIGHRIGVLRLATIAPRQYLGTATERIRKIEHEIGRTFRSITSSDVRPDEIRERIKTIHINYFPELSKDFGGNIRNRLRLALRYKRQLDDLMRKLEVMPLGNLKPFDQMTEDFVASTVFHIEQLLDAYNTVLADFYEVRQIAINEGILQKNSEIERLQIGAELLAFLGLLPYYIGNSTSETYHVFARVPKENYDAIDMALWTFSWLIGLRFAAIRLAKSGSIKILKDPDTISVVLTLGAALILSLGLMVSRDRRPHSECAGAACSPTSVQTPNQPHD